MSINCVTLHFVGYILEYILDIFYTVFSASIITIHQPSTCPKTKNHTASDLANKEDKSPAFLSINTYTLQTMHRIVCGVTMSCWQKMVQILLQ